MAMTTNENNSNASIAFNQLAINETYLSLMCEYCTWRLVLPSMSP
jgi:hypothetical protein